MPLLPSPLCCFSLPFPLFHTVLLMSLCPGARSTRQLQGQFSTKTPDISLDSTRWSLSRTTTVQCLTTTNNGDAPDAFSHWTIKYLSVIKSILFGYSSPPSSRHTLSTKGRLRPAYPLTSPALEKRHHLEFNNQKTR